MRQEELADRIAALIQAEWPDGTAVAHENLGDSRGPYIEVSGPTTGSWAVHLDEEMVHCWHTEPGTPCDWNRCEQRETR